MALYSNYHKKPRRAKGTRFFVFRYYIWGAMTTFSGLCFVAYYYSSINRDIYKKYIEPIDHEAIRNKEDLGSTRFGLTKSSEELKKDMYRLKKEKDTSLY